jgi:hypothetical protein
VISSDPLRLIPGFEPRAELGDVVSGPQVAVEGRFLQVRCACRGCGAHLPGVLARRSLGGDCTVCGGQDIEVIADDPGPRRFPCTD